jgi:hypothetical protein
LSKPIAISTFSTSNPPAGDSGADVALVLVVGGHNLNRLAQHCAAGILDRHGCGDNRAWAAEVRVEAGLVIENPDSNDVVGDLVARAGNGHERGCKGEQP